MTWRKLVNMSMFGITALCTLVTVSTLFFILGALIYHGATSLNWAFFTRLPVPVGETGGGMANAIVGTGKLLLLTILMGVPAGFIGGVYLSEFGGAAFSSVVRYTADLLNGAPSIVIGILAYALVVKRMGHFSTFAGGFALSLIVIPITLRSTEQFLRVVPQSLREGALALGASKWKAVVTVVIPAAMRGVLTGTILGVARVAGETAPLLFTAFGNPYWSAGWLHPTSALPMMVYTYGLAPYEDWHRQAWAAGLVLLVMMLIANIGARLILSPRGAQST
ncbi:MAG TPA: phosphate ABC transporter permease PstA [Bryobacteraceae bacterium]|nr:phosphate ABC transporter permease PstA [Bryobacteraceae bacterium]